MCTWMDMFANADPRLAEVCYHPVGKYGTAAEDPGGIWQLLVSRELVGYVDNFLSRFFGYLCKEERCPQTGVGFFFIMLIATHKSVQAMLSAQLKDDEHLLDHFRQFVKLATIVTMETLQVGFHSENATSMLEYGVAMCRFSWKSRCAISLLNAESHLTSRYNKDRENRLNRNKKERQMEKRKKQAERQQEQKQEMQNLKTGKYVR